MCMILRPFIFTENCEHHSKGGREHIKKNIITKCLEFIKILILISFKNSSQNSIRLGIFAIFDNLFTANILGILEKRGFTAPMQGCSLKTPWNFSVFALLLNSKQNKASPLETSENFVTQHRNRKT